MARTTLLCLVGVVLALLACKSPQPEPEPTPAVSAPAVSTPAAASAPPEPPPAVPDDWLDFTSSNGRFTMRVPRKPTLDVQTVPTLSGPSKTHLYTATAGSGVVYQAGYSDFPEPPSDPAQAQKLLEDAQHGAAGNLGGNVSQQRQLTVQGFPAREFAMLMTSRGVQLRYWGRLVLADTRLYQLQVIAPTGQGDEQKRERFFASFVIRSDAY